MTRDHIQAAHYHPGRRRPIRLVVLHATQGGEGPGRARNVAAGFHDPHGRVASAHAVADAGVVIDCVHDADTAFGAVGANADGLHLEQCGMSEQDRAHWLDPASLATIGNGAARVAEWCRAYAIPPVQLGVAQLQDLRSRGITDHATVSKAFPGTGHWDPGPAYPWDVFLDRLDAHLGGAPIVPPAIDLTHPAIFIPGPQWRPQAPEPRWLPAVLRYATKSNAKGDLFRNFQIVEWNPDEPPAPGAIPRDSIAIGMDPRRWVDWPGTSGVDGGQTIARALDYLGIGT